MNRDVSRIMYKVNELMEGGDLSIILNEIKNRIALDILNTDMRDKRDELYYLAKGVDLLERELQSYVNTIAREKENDE